jgi:hypothetical protein
LTLSEPPTVKLAYDRDATRGRPIDPLPIARQVMRSTVIARCSGVQSTSFISRMSSTALLGGDLSAMLWRAPAIGPSWPHGTCLVGGAQ